MKSFQILIVSFLIIVNSISIAFCQDITLSWDPSPSSGVIGYSVYYKADNENFPFNGTEAAQGPSPINVGLDFSLTLSELANDKSYYFAVTAYDINDNESTYSNIVSTTVISTPPSVPVAEEPTYTPPSVPVAEEPTYTPPSVPVAEEPTYTPPSVPVAEEPTETIYLIRPENNAQNEPIAVTFQWETVSSTEDITYTLYYGTDREEVTTSSLFLTLHPPPTNNIFYVVSITLLVALLLSRIKYRSLPQIKHLPQTSSILLVILLGGILTACGGSGGGSDSSSDNSAKSPAPPATETVLYSINKGSSDYHQAYDLEASTTYYWKVIAIDTQNTYESEVRQFTTEAF